jgi:hypothetical protein
LLSLSNQATLNILSLDDNLRKYLINHYPLINTWQATTERFLYTTD